MTLVEKHPQRQEIINQLVAGVSLRQIGATVNPRLNHHALSRFRIKMLADTTRSIRGRSTQAVTLKALGQPEELPAVRQQVRNELENELRDRSAKRRQREASAESHQQIDEKTGEVRHNMDHAALGRYDANGLRDIELRAKLAGILDSGDAGTATVKAVIMMPGTHAVAGVAQSVSPAEQIGIGVEVVLTR